MTFRCFLPAWIAAWVTAIFLPSVIIAYLGISLPAAAIGTGLERLPATSWKVADDVGPVVKLMTGGLLLAGFLALGRVRGLGSGGRFAVATGIGVMAILFTIAFAPSAYSRGFAAALTGARFDVTTTPIYLLGGMLAGVVFALVSDRCSRARP